MIDGDNKHDMASDQWKAMTRKRILAVLLIVHWFEDDEKHFQDFFALWDYIFFNNPLPKRRPKTKGKKTAHKDSLDEQLSPDEGQHSGGENSDHEHHQETA